MKRFLTLNNHLGSAADPISRAAPKLTDLIKPARVPGAAIAFKTSGSPTLGQG